MQVKNGIIFWTFLFFCKLTKLTKTDESMKRYFSAFLWISFDQIIVQAPSIPHFFETDVMLKILIKGQTEPIWALFLQDILVATTTKNPPLGTTSLVLNFDNFFFKTLFWIIHHTSLIDLTNWDIFQFWSLVSLLHYDDNLLPLHFILLQKPKTQRIPKVIPLGPPIRVINNIR